jgi:hypothetical protein
MHTRLPRLLLTLSFCLLLVPAAAHGLDHRDVIQLKEAGIEDETLRVLIREKSIETGAMTVAEIKAMKRAGLSDQTIRMLIEENSFLKNRQPIVYGEDLRTVEFTTVDDIIELKQAGISDEVIQAILWVLKDESTRECEAAQRMLEDMQIRIDFRGDS